MCVGKLSKVVGHAKLYISQFGVITMTSPTRLVSGPRRHPLLTVAQAPKPTGSGAQTISLPGPW